MAARSDWCECLCEKLRVICLITAVRGIDYGFIQAGNRHASNSKDSLSRQDNEIDAKYVLMQEAV